MMSAQRIKFVSDDNEIALFLSSTVSKEKNTSRNPRDTLIINQLIQYVNSLTTDKSNLFDLVSDLDNDINKLNDDIATMKHENTSLIEQQHVQKQVLQEQKDDFIRALSEAQEGDAPPQVKRLTSIQNMNALTSIRNVFTGNENEFDDVKERIEEQQMENYKQAIDQTSKVSNKQTQNKTNKTNKTNKKQQYIKSNIAF